ncbi:putative Amino acid or sugar ABC transport system, permease protein [Hyella patelloides LEGE 07179]|uniref:Putative Amino acid or sugar ABC transport system, permease protein n=1 Tax=Hyella patelloides LEGE 07179 TaxID=945734 RepID=A0A563VSX5_9CYAN|nr:branched-chain amino acid ABC transporter permease [Hyella patelloides]VEP14525.1 putative Amino acid or sugar ABC transport system, permease protein [Hyella patelloides LEGE 07179]
MLQQFIVSGIAIGSVYGLVALGLQITYSVSNTMNFSQGASVMLGAVVCYSLNITYGWHIAIAIPLSLIVCAVFGLIVERLAVRPFAVDGSSSWLLTTIAVGIIAENLAMVIFGKEVRGYPSPLAQTPINILGFGVFPLELLTPLIGIAIAFAIRFTFTHTLWGKAFLAASENPDAAKIMGINVEGAIAFAYALSTVLAGVAGILIAPIYNVSAGMGTLLGLKAFATAIIGGLSSPWGIAIAGILYGIGESLAAGYLGGSYREIIGFALVILALTLKPNGLFGKSQTKKV